MYSQYHILSLPMDKQIYSIINSKLKNTEIYIYLYIDTNTYICNYIYIFICCQKLQIQMHIQIYTHKNIQMCIGKVMFIYTHQNINTYMYIQRDTAIYTGIQISIITAICTKAYRLINIKINVQVYTYRNKFKHTYGFSFAYTHNIYLHKLIYI